MRLRPPWQLALLAALGAVRVWYVVVLPRLAFLKDDSTAGRVLAQSLALAVVGAFATGAALALAWLARLDWVRTTLSRALHDETPPLDPAERRWSRGWLWGGLAFVAVVFVLLERMTPYYFTQDDNLVVLFPGFLQGARSAESGVWPVWNPYQYLGSPSLSTGFYALSYPPAYLAHFVARYLLGDEYATMEVLAAFHLCGGYLATWLLARRLRLSAPLAAAGSLAFVLSGYTLIAGRGWFAIVALTVWAPLIFAGVARLRDSALDWKWTLLVGGSIGMFFHAGNAQQMWIYTLLLAGFAVAISWAAGTLSARRVFSIVPALLLGLAIALPLLVPQLRMLRQLARRGGIGGGIGAGLPGMLLPYPFFTGAHPNDWGNVNVELMTQLYYSGTLFPLIVAIVGLLALVHRFSRRSMANNVWLLCALLALWLALGDEGLLWTVMSKLPIFSQFKEPHKFLTFLNLFCVLGGGVALERALGGISRRRARTATAALASAVGVLLLYHAALSRTAFFVYGDRPYPPLPAVMTELLNSHDPPQRILSIAPERSGKPGYAIALKHHLPSVYGVISFSGYDSHFENLLPETLKTEKLLTTDPVGAAAAYGVRWLVVQGYVGRGHDGFVFPDKFGSRFYPKEFGVLAAEAVYRYVSPSLSILELPNADPLAFLAGDRLALPVELRGDGVRVDLAGTRGGLAVVNVLERPEMAGEIDGRAVALTADSWGRVTVEIPPGAQRLKVEYRPPFREGWLWALCALALAAAAQLASRRC